MRCLLELLLLVCLDEILTHLRGVLLLLIVFKKSAKIFRLMHWMVINALRYIMQQNVTKSA